MSMAPEHSYRTKIEVLRDFLRAAREPAPKTRIIGAANLNPSSFQRYLRLCAENHLVTSTAGGYVATPRALRILEAIEGVISKTSELEGAVHYFERSAQGRPAPGGHYGSALRYASREAWGGIVLGSPGKRKDPGESGYLKALPVDPDARRPRGQSRTLRPGPEKASARPAPRRARPMARRAGKARRRASARSRSGR
jgi:predicted transcriptional regulator